MEFLFRRFIKDYKETEKPAVRTAYGRLASWVGILCNIVLFAAKIVAGALSGSVSIVADAVNNLSDASSGVISLLGFKLAAKPADKEHPYGHGRYEYLSGLMVSVLILVIGVELFRSSLNKVLNPAPVEFGWLAIGILTASAAVKLWMMLFYCAAGKKIESNTLVAAAADSRNDVAATLAVLAAALLSRYTALELDGYMGLAVALFILINGFGLVRETLDPLLGRAPKPAEVRRIRDAIMRYPGVLGTHDLLVHDYGPGRQFASVHVEMAAEEDVLASHEIIDQIERDFLEQGLHLLVHFDPIITEPGKTDDLRQWLAALARSVNPDFTIHDLRVVPGKTRAKLVFDCLVPADTAMNAAEVRCALTEAVQAQRPGYDCAITVDYGLAAIPGEAE